MRGDNSGAAIVKQSLSQKCAYASGSQVLEGVDCSCKCLKMWRGMSVCCLQEQPRAVRAEQPPGVPDAAEHRRKKQSARSEIRSMLIGCVYVEGDSRIGSRSRD